MLGAHEGRYGRGVREPYYRRQPGEQGVGHALVYNMTVTTSPA